MKFPSFLRIAVNELPGICELRKDDDNKIIMNEGSDAEFLRVLSELLNFTYELFIPEDKQWGVKLPDGNWTGMIGKVHRNETDMSMCAITMTEPRSNAVYFSYPYEIQQLVFATRAPRRFPKVLAFVLPFSPGVWYLLLSLMCLMPFAWRILLKTIHPIRKLFSDVFKSFLYGSISVKPISLTDYALITSWLFGTCFLSFSYTAVLLSFLTLPLHESLVRNVPQLAKAVEEGRYKVSTFEGTILHEGLKKSPVAGVRLIGKAIADNGWYVLAEEKAVKDAVYASNMAVLAQRSFFSDTFGDSLALSEDIFFPLPMGLVVGENFCCKEYLDYKLRWMTAAGLYQKCQTSFKFRARWKYMVSHSSASEDAVTALSMEDLSGAFIMLCFGYGVSFLSLVIEMCLLKAFKKLKAI